MEKFRRKEPRNTIFLNIENPLSTEIRDEPFLLNYKTPQLDDYNRTGDLITHLSCFQVVMMVQSLSEAAVCKLFPTTLKGPAAIWYQSLKEGSIQSFDELARAFRTHFAPSIQRKKKSSDLKLCYQKPGESLQSYIGRFNAEAVEVGNLNDDTVIDAMKDNTTMMAFRDNLITNPNNNEPVRYPPKLQYEGDRKKYCQFHDGHGHVTDECGSLKKEIDRLVQVGRLKDFVTQIKNYNSGGSYRGEHSGKREEAPPPKRQNVSGVINTIAGGMADPKYK
ncbi:uncharacterized protein LOC126681640 [Mercurialis annua]|uniref:uncharacterized protein LOC126681640 n=1 Tax=Mercurialis annua TaxID=3986 RepID=UPI00215E5CCE|nr:uncharacterized protein LOC126681640 [Mercurialis annua]